MNLWSAVRQNPVDATLAICAIVVTGLLVRREIGGSGPGSGPVLTRQVANWKVFDSGGHYLQDSLADPGIEIVEFSDFQCPYCATLSHTLDSLGARLGSAIRVRYRHFPLSAIHSEAIPSATAAECAAREGKFKAMHDVLFGHQADLGRTPYAALATAAGVSDSKTFIDCLTESAPKAAITRDSQAAADLGLNGTPALLIGPTLVLGAIPLDSLDRLVHAQLERATHP